VQLRKGRKRGGRGREDEQKEEWMWWVANLTNLRACINDIVSITIYHLLFQI